MEHFGRYELRRRIGVGGMAEVYEAVAIVAEGVEKPVVIKRILEEHSRDPAFRSMFAEEARIALGLSHPNIVQVFDFGKVDDRVFLAMELVRGRDLGAFLTRMRGQSLTTPPAVAVYAIAEVARGLDYAHRLTGSDGRPMNLVHRDVSPQNILVSTEGAVKIGDFGIAKAGGSRETGTVSTTVRGKVRYMSPEQVEGKSIDGRSDLFSLGVVFYEMLTGAHAFDGETDYDVLAAVRRAKPASPSRYAPTPTTLEKIVLRMLAREPRDRFARGLDIARELEAFAARESMTATSEALGEFLGVLFPELVRASDELGETVIRRLPEVSVEETASGTRVDTLGGEPSVERTRIRRMPDDEDGMKVFVSEELVESTAASTVPPREESPSPEESTDTGAAETTTEGAAVREARRAPVGAIGSSAARAKSRNDATLARIPMPPPQPPAEEPTDAPVAETHAPSARQAETDARPRASARPPPRRAATPASPPAAAEGTEGGTEPPGSRADPPSRSSAAWIERAGPRRSGGGARALPIFVFLLAIVGAGAFVAWQKLHSGGSLPGEEVVVGSRPGSRFGRLALVGRKGDRVVVDNEPKGHLPLPPLVLTTGLHTVSVTGGINADFAVNITDGETEDKTLGDADPGDIAPQDGNASARPRTP